MENALTNAASQSNFTGLDWGIVVVYVLLSVGVAFFVKRYAGNMTNFGGAGRAGGRRRRPKRSAGRSSWADTWRTLVQQKVRITRRRRAPRGS